MDFEKLTAIGTGVDDLIERVGAGTPCDATK
jgi:hypothetical protein